MDRNILKKSLIIVFVFLFLSSSCFPFVTASYNVDHEHDLIIDDIFIHYSKTGTYLATKVKDIGNAWDEISSDIGVHVKIYRCLFGIPLIPVRSYTIWTWIDAITIIEPPVPVIWEGFYRFCLTVNPNRLIEESDYYNNCYREDWYNYFFDWYPFNPRNNKPEISNPNPSNNQENVPITLKELSFKIHDADYDSMNYSATTDPFIGSGSKNNVRNGIYSIPINGLELSTTYTWTVTATDGKETTTKKFSFTTVLERPIVTNPNPINKSSTTTNLSELSFTLTDMQGDKMNYTVETSPYVGSGSAIGVGNGTYSLKISNLKKNISYYWYVNVTDGEHWTREKFSFHTASLGLLGYWSFNDGTAIDNSGNNNGSLYGATYLPTGGPDGSGCLSFDGVDDYIKINHISDFMFVNQDLTFCCWVVIYDNLNPCYFITLSGCDIIPGVFLQKWDSGGYDGRIVMITAGLPSNQSVAKSIDDGNALPKNTWMFLAGVVDYPNSVKLYIDGTLQNSVSAVDYDVTHVNNLELYIAWAPWCLGHYKPLYGKMDEVRIYNIALSEQEIQLLYDSYLN